MAKRQAVLSLPNEVLIKLHQRLVDSNFGEYSEHSEWLLALGYSISKSTLHRYAKDHEYKIRSANRALDTVDGMDSQRMDIRMRCLEVASNSVTDGDFDLLIKKAEELFCWVCSD